jgi:hypothetical protein
MHENTTTRSADDKKRFIAICEHETKGRTIQAQEITPKTIYNVRFSNKYSYSISTSVCDNVRLSNKDSFISPPTGQVPPYSTTITTKTRVTIKAPPYATTPRRIQAGLHTSSIGNGDLDPGALEGLPARTDTLPGHIGVTLFGHFYPFHPILPYDLEYCVPFYSAYTLG